ncbi:hypothetical protein RO3G_02413 [Rhizopus delemar RA 99-880]|uniref:Uncharacterized protein n=1 Tax=Rhizopus delemar (strain RA 99-880 / ATCC MYA-4621 / FGSC 9543 / NRRL 43880) TaxID=246409 RepID=I1BNC9_RHIO9|nr:hypothetical protein RO3G_02413 [Rhizopus delemar RA 99-880]|eukprot:EIE77709.1 hypothetical protein RO3G_02413 [Rhizopus delemar RA 99-880]
MLQEDDASCHTESAYLVGSKDKKRDDEVRIVVWAKNENSDKYLCISRLRYQIFVKSF